MAYGEKYKYYFYWNRNKGGSDNYYKVSFLKDGYASTVTELTPSDDPFSISIKGQRDTLDAIILGSSAEMSFIVAKTDVAAYDADFLSSDYKNVIVKLIQDPDGTPIVKWAGILLPENASRDFQGYKYNYQISASDGLADLKSVLYSTDGTTSGSAYNGFANILNIIKTAIGKAIDISDLQLDFRVQLGTYSDQMTSTENAFKENEIAQELFSDGTGNDIKYDTCYEVLEKILSSFYCSIAQADGYYWIFCHGERTSYYFEYDWATLTQQSRTNYNRNITLFGITGKTLFDRGTLYKIPGYKTFDITVYNKDYDIQLLSNPGFDSNVTGWTNGDADDSSNTFTVFQYADLSGSGGAAEARYSGAATAGFYNFHTTAASTLTIDTNLVTVTVIVEHFDETPNGTTSPKIQMRLWNATDGYTTGATGQQTITQVGGFFTYTDTFDVSGLAVAANYLDIQIEVTDASTTVAWFYFNDIRLNQANTNNTSDWIYRGTRSSGSQKINEEKIIYIADRIQSDNDLCSIKDDGGNYTTTWARYGETETLWLVSTLQQYIINDNNSFMDYVRFTLYDEDEEYNIFNIMYTLAGDQYHRIIGMTKNYVKATIKMDIKEVDFDDAAYDTYPSKLGTRYGKED